MSVLTILKKSIKWRFHNRLTIVITILQPILWLILYSNVAGQTMSTTGIGNYTAFIFPGLIILICFSTSSSCGIMNYLMKTDGSFYRILIAPIQRSSIILGQGLEATLCAFLEIGIMGIIAFFLSVNIFENPVGLIMMSILIFLTSLCMALVSYGISLMLPNEIIYETLMNAIVLPIFFLSSALFPVNGITGMLKTIIQLNPFTYVINSIRSILLYNSIPYVEVLQSILTLIVLSILSFLFAKSRLHRETNS